MADVLGGNPPPRNTYTTRADVAPSALAPSQNAAADGAGNLSAVPVAATPPSGPVAAVKAASWAVRLRILSLTSGALLTSSGAITAYADTLGGARWTSLVLAAIGMVQLVAADVLTGVTSGR